MANKLPVLILPGLGNSGPDHWQSHWERRDPSCMRVIQDEWNTPRRADWVARLEDVIGARTNPVVLAAHSSACALVAHWASTAPAERTAVVRGALLVAPSDPTNPNYPVGPTGFEPVPLHPLPFPTIVVASSNDQYVTIESARRYAQAWQSQFVALENAGHINAASGHGEWMDGYALLDTLR